MTTTQTTPAKVGGARWVSRTLPLCGGCKPRAAFFSDFFISQCPAVFRACARRRGVLEGNSRQDAGWKDSAV